MYPWRSALDYIGRAQFRQVLEPQACRLGFAMSELPGLDNLVRFAVQATHDADGILNGNTLNGSIDEHHEKLYCFFLIMFLVLEPTSATDGQVCAWWKSNHHIPRNAFIVPGHKIPNITLHVVSLYFGLQNVARPCIMTTGYKCLTDDATELTGN